MSLETPILAALRWQYPRAAIVVLPAMAVLSVYVLWAYAAQVRQVGRAWAWVLPGLRLAALAALAVALLRPAVTRPRTPAERGPVVFLIDDSRSMSVADTGRPPGQRVALAAAFGRLPPGSRDAAAVAVELATAQLAPLTDAVARARAELAYARLAGRDTDAATARLDAAIDSLQHAAKSVADTLATTGSARTPRLERMLGLLATPPAVVDRETWLDRAGERARSAATEATNARADADARLYDDDPAVRDPADALVSRSRARLAWTAVFDPTVGLLARVGEGVPAQAFTVGERAVPLADPAVPPSPDGVASDLAGGVRAVLDRLTASPSVEPPRAIVLLSDGRQVNGAPPDSVAAVAAGVPVHTVAVAAQAPSPNVAVTEVAVPRYAYPGEPVACRATLRATAASGVSTDVTFEAGGDRQTQRVTLAGDRPASVTFTWVPRVPGPTKVSVRADPIGGEATLDDNADEAWTAVVGSPARVAVYSPTASMSAATTCAALSAMPNVRVLPDGLDQLANADVAILFDVTARSLTSAQWDGVTRLASERGGGVILVPPEAGFGPAATGSSPMGRLLPFAGPPPLRIARPTSRFSTATDALSLADGSPESARHWDALAPFDGYLPLAPLRPDSRSLLLAGDTPVVAERPVGAGRSLCLASDQTWRWRQGEEGTRDFDRFWAALVRRAAGDPYAINSADLALDVDAFAVVPGQPVHVRARLVNASTATTGKLRVLAASGKTVLTIPCHPRGGGRFDATVPGLPAGEYTLAADDGSPSPLRAPLSVRPSAKAELADLSGDEGFLRRLSDATGGQAFRIDQLDAIAGVLAGPALGVSRPIELPLWDSPYLFAGVLGLLTAEWALRRRAGLA